MIATIRCDATAAWQALREHYTSAGRAFDLRTAFASDAGRYEAFALEAPEVFADLSKNLWDSRTRDLLLELAHQCGVAHWRDAMVAGAPINSTEGRAVLHTALRAPRGAGPHSQDVHEVLATPCAGQRVLRSN